MDFKNKKEKVLPVAELPVEEKKEEPQEEAPKKVSIMDMVKEV